MEYGYVGGGWVGIGKPDHTIFTWNVSIDPYTISK